MKTKGAWPRIPSVIKTTYIIYKSYIYSLHRSLWVYADHIWCIIGRQSHTMLLSTVIQLRLHTRKDARSLCSICASFTVSSVTTEYRILTWKRRFINGNSLNSRPRPFSSCQCAQGTPDDIEHRRAKHKLTIDGQTLPCSLNTYIVQTNEHLADWLHFAVIFNLWTFNDSNAESQSLHMMAEPALFLSK